MFYNLLIHFFIKRHLGCFKYLVVMNKAAINLFVLVLCDHEFSNQLCKYLEMSLVDHGITLFSFVRNC